MGMISVAFKAAILLVLLGILGVGIGVLIVNMGIRDDIEVTPAVPTYPTEIPVTYPTSRPPVYTSQKPVDPVTDDPANPTDPDFKNIPASPIIQKTDRRYEKFSQISNLYERWMNVSVDPCNDFYHYVCGKGQGKEDSPFLISQDKDDAVINQMWNVPAAYWNTAPLPVKQANWFRHQCNVNDGFTVDDQQAKMREMMKDFTDFAAIDVPFFNPDKKTTMDKTAMSRMIGYAQGKLGAYALLTPFASDDFKDPDNAYIYYVDQPLPFFTDDAYSSDFMYKHVYRDQIIEQLTETVQEWADLMGIDIPDNSTVMKMAGDIADFDKVISNTMQQDPIVRRQVERNYNPFTLADLNKNVDQFDWVAFVQAALTLLGDKITVDDTWRVIIMEKDYTNVALNNLIKKTDKNTVANYIFLKGYISVSSAVPPPGRKTVKKERPMDKYRMERKPMDKRTLAGMLRRPEPRHDNRVNIAICGSLVENLLPWASTRMYVDSDIPDKKDRQTLKDNVAEIANWIFFGFRSQLDQLHWMDAESKKGAFNKLDNIQLNVAFPDWVTDDAKLTAFYAGLDIAETDNFMQVWLKLRNWMRLGEVQPFIVKTPRDRGDFSSFVGITNAWYQPQMNSITFPEGILQEPFYSPDYPLATIFGGLGSISGHELTHGFDDQGVQWDGIGALNAWMTKPSQKSFDQMAQCVIDEYSGFCPFPKVCVNGANTQGENIADNGGIQAAYKALKAYESLNGADPRLPGFGSSFTSDQLFFLTFAQTWCDDDQDAASFARQIAGDVHSPAIYRVLGTIQNFPAFKNAFNCPANTPYTPDEHCNVWTDKPF